MSVLGKLQDVTWRDKADWGSVKAEIVLWAAVPACLLAAWMYASPTARYGPDTYSIGFPHI